MEQPSFYVRGGRVVYRESPEKLYETKNGYYYNGEEISKALFDALNITMNNKHATIFYNSPEWLPALNASPIAHYVNISESIERVIFNNPATIVYWKDKTKTLVICQPGDEYNKEIGLAMCIIKKVCGNKGNYNDIFEKWCK